MDISGKTALVTGGASGLGAAVIAMLQKKGAKTVSYDLQKSQTADLSLVGDVTSEAEVTAALDKIENQFGTPHILVNCAGIGTASRVVGRDGPMPLEKFEKVIRVNLIGSFNMIRLTGARMSESAPVGEERGVIVSTASVAAFDGQIGQAAYSASKGGIAAMTLPIAREFARFGIRVLTLAPGIFETPLLGELPEEARESIGASIPFPSRLGKPEEFAALVETCVTNAYLNGETIRIDGAVRLAPK